MKEDILKSWNDSTARKSIIEFVKNVTTEGSTDFVPIKDRVATFDNDGTLWCEQPLQVQFFYVIDRIKVIAESNPEMKDTQPFKAFLEQDLKTISTFTKQQLMEFLFTAMGEKTPEELASAVKNWFETARNPKFNFSYYDCAFKPQLELLDYLRANDFKVFIVSGGGIEFMRVISEKIYGIPTDCVIGSSVKTEIVMNGTVPVINRLKELANFDDREEKVLNIHLHIGKRPILAFGNSDGDLAMLRYTLAGNGKRLALLLHHDDAEREVAYDRDFKISPLNEALDVAAAEGIQVVSMKNDWTRVF
ncbi:MAG: haloacid dehalogenase-like hydrolase [Ignavibacteria bacterium]|nr:haloacid dehalogenase-like hydrolase [Ignavibacteria bacterium]